MKFINSRNCYILYLKKKKEQGELLFLAKKPNLEETKFYFRTNKIGKTSTLKKKKKTFGQKSVKK